MDFGRVWEYGQAPPPPLNPTTAVTLFNKRRLKPASAPALALAPPPPRDGAEHGLPRPGFFLGVGLGGCVDIRIDACVDACIDICIDACVDVRLNILLNIRALLRVPVHAGIRRADADDCLGGVGPGDEGLREAGVVPGAVPLAGFVGVGCGVLRGFKFSLHAMGAVCRI